MSIFAQYKNKSCKVLIQETKEIRNSSTTISTAFLNNNYFKRFTSILLKCSFKFARFTLHRKSFLKDLLRHGKHENKRGNL